MDDLISRQAAIDAIEHRLAEPAYQHTGEDWYVGMNCAESELYELPSAQPERKRGEWLEHYAHEDGKRDGVWCSECREHYYFGGQLMNFCPNCGADMRGEEDD